MGFLSHLFADNKTRAHEVLADEERRVQLWEELIRNAAALEKLAEEFSPKNLAEKLIPKRAQEVLVAMQQLISKELISLQEEERSDEEILTDLKALADTRLSFKHHLQTARSARSSAVARHNAVLALMRRAHEELRVGSEAIKVLHKKLQWTVTAGHMGEWGLIETAVQHLYELFYFSHPIIAYRFMEKHTKPAVYEEVARIARAVLVDEDIREKELAEEDRFVLELRKEMFDRQSDHAHRKLGEEIYQALGELAYSEAGTDDMDEVMKHYEEMLEKEQRTPEFVGIIRELRPELTQAQAEHVFHVFRDCFHDTAFY